MGSPSMLAILLFFEICQSAPVTLYNHLDNVVELTDANITSIYNSNQLWVVEFYAHWCGHCKRFAPRWIEMADLFKGWKPHVQIAALNCAEQESCNNFLITGTPTLRVFYPNTLSESIGVELHEFDQPNLADEVLTHILTAQRQQMLKQLPSLEPFRPNSIEDVKSMVSSNLPKSTAFFIITNLVNDQYPAGRRLQLYASSRKLVNIKLMETWLSPELITSDYFDTTNLVMLPAVVVVPADGGEKKYFASLEDELLVANKLQEWDKELGTAEIQEVITTTGSSKLATTTHPPTTSPPFSPWTPPLLNVGPSFAMPEHSEDVVFASDLEKAIQYSIVKEIGSRAVLSTEHMSVIYLYLDVISQYAPVRQEIVDFVVSLKEWPVRMGLQTIRKRDYKRKVNELTRLYRPFDGTPEEWRGCKGSQPEYRGYPCSLWTLFHTLMTNAAIQGDPGMINNGSSTVARAMVGYIKSFFSCRHCADNFAMKVDTLGFLPRTPQDSVLWLWQIHNMANSMLMGDLTEDPMNPKIIWPSSLNCPQCWGGFLQPIFSMSRPVVVNGQSWYLDKVSLYLTRVYRKEHVIPNNVTITDSVKEKRIQQLTELMKETIEKLQSATNEDQSGDAVAPKVRFNLQTLMTINGYCTTLFKNMR